MAQLKCYTVSQLKKMKTIETRSIRVGGVVFQLDVKRVASHDDERFRWSLMHTPEDSDRVLSDPDAEYARIQRWNGSKWLLAWPPSITRMIEPMEVAARRAMRAGEHVVAALLLHALVEALLRIDPHESCRSADNFWGAARAYRRRLLREGWSQRRADRRIVRVDRLNRLRNKVIHELLPRDGFDATNQRVERGELRKCFRLYADMIKEMGPGLPM